MKASRLKTHQEGNDSVKLQGKNKNIVFTQSQEAEEILLMFLFCLGFQLFGLQLQIENALLQNTDILQNNICKMNFSLSFYAATSPVL